MSTMMGLGKFLESFDPGGSNLVDCLMLDLAGRIG